MYMPKSEYTGPVVYSGRDHLYSDISGVNINDDQGAACGPFQAGQLPAHEADDLVQLCSTLFAILAQALEALCCDGFTHLLGPIHLCRTQANSSP